MDPDTNPEMVYLMRKLLKNFNGVHLNKILDIQGKGFKDLPMMNNHMDKEDKKSAMCYRKVLDFFPGNYNFRHIAGSEFPKDLVVKLCDQIRPGVKMIMDLGAFPGGMGKKLLREGGLGCR